MNSAAKYKSLHSHSFVRGNCILILQPELDESTESKNRKFIEIYPPQIPISIMDVVALTHLIIMEQRDLQSAPHPSPNSAQPQRSSDPVRSWITQNGSHEQKAGVSDAHHPERQEGQLLNYKSGQSPSVKAICVCNPPGQTLTDAKTNVTPTSLRRIPSSHRLDISPTTLLTMRPLAILNHQTYRLRQFSLVVILNTASYQQNIQISMEPMKESEKYGEAESTFYRQQANQVPSLIPSPSPL